MRFLQVKLQNFRQYKDLTFDFPKNEFDLHIIKSQNGVGKTNLLNSINWCLYGDEPHLAGSADQSLHEDEMLPICNIQALEDADKAGDKSCDVCVTITAEADDKKLIISRSATFNSKVGIQTGKDRLVVKTFPKVGDEIIEQDKEAEAAIESYVPKRIREYFFFDGERLLNYLTGISDDTSKIKDSIYEISGVNYINRCSSHLTDFQNQYKKKISELSPDLEVKAAELQKALDLVTNKEREIRELYAANTAAVKAIEQANKTLDGNERFRDANIRYEANKRQIEKESGDLKEARQELAKFVVKYLPRVMLHDINRDSLAYIDEREKDDTGSSSSRIEDLKKSIEENRCSQCKQDLTLKIIDEFKKEIKAREANPSLKALIEIKSDVRRSLNIDEYDEEKERIMDKIRGLQDSIDDLTDKNDALLKEIEKSDIVTIEAAARSKKENEELRDLNNRKIGSYEAQLKALKQNTEVLKKEYSEAVERDKACGEYREKYKLVTSAKEIVDEVRNTIVDEMKHTMEKKTMEIFNDLLWKSETYGRVEIDDNFRLKLYHKRNDMSCLYSTSAAEKELLALSFTIALHEVSGYDNMLFIDTPVGRVSDDNRGNFAKVLRDLSLKKQLIITFTPSEYSPEIQEILSKRVVASFHELRSEASEDVTTIKED